MISSTGGYSGSPSYTPETPEQAQKRRAYEANREKVVKVSFVVWAIIVLSVVLSTEWGYWFLGLLGGFMVASIIIAIFDWVSLRE